MSRMSDQDTSQPHPTREENIQAIASIIKDVKFAMLTV